MGRHTVSSPITGRLFRGLALTVVVGLVGGASWYALTRTDASANAGRCPITLRVATASSFATVVAAAGRTLRSGDNCVHVDVKNADGREAAGQVSQGQVDVWIPDDGSWIATVPQKSFAPAGTAGSGTVLASSPIYLVTDQATATKLRAAGGSWVGLARMLTTGTGARLVVRNPAFSGDGLIAAGAVGEAVWLAEGMDASSLVLANVLKVTRTVNYNLAATPESPGEVGLVPEYALLPTLGLAQPDRAYLAPTDHTAALRFTWLPTASAATDPKRTAALSRLLAAFTHPEVVRAATTVGLRGPDGRRPPVPGADQLPEVTAKPFDTLGPHHVEHVFATWDPEDRRSNVLIVVDVASTSPSGSPTPSASAGTGRQQAIDVLRQGCRLLAGLMPDGSRLGLWEVGADGTQTYRKVIPTARLDAGQRASIDRALGELTARRAGPGVYDAIVDAYRSVRDDYRTDMFNQVLVLTDDQNKDSANVQAVETLVQRLNQLRDPQRPVNLSVVVLSQKAAADRLKTSLKPVDAYVGNAVGAADVQAAFIHVVAGGLHD